MAKIELYRDSNYGGRSLTTEEDLENLKNNDFNDEASSCKVEAGTWMLYKDIRLALGLPLGSDQAISLKIQN